MNPLLTGFPQAHFPVLPVGRMSGCWVQVSKKLSFCCHDAAL